MSNCTNEWKRKGRFEKCISDKQDDWLVVGSRVLRRERRLKELSCLQVKCWGSSIMNAWSRKEEQWNVNLGTMTAGQVWDAWGTFQSLCPSAQHWDQRSKVKKTSATEMKILESTAYSGRCNCGPGWDFPGGDWKRAVSAEKILSQRPKEGTERGCQ